MPEPTNPAEHAITPAEKQLLKFAIGVTGHLAQRLEASLAAAKKVAGDLAKTSTDKPQPVPTLALARERVDILDPLAAAARQAHTHLQALQTFTTPATPPASPVIYQLKPPTPA